MKTLALFLALVNALLAGLLIAACISPAELAQGRLWWLMLKIVAAAGVIPIGVATWLGGARGTNPGWIALCSLFLVALGAATVVWTFHIELVTGDMEFHMIVYGGSLAVQGIASLFGLVGDSRSVTI